MTNPLDEGIGIATYGSVKIRGILWHLGYALLRRHGVRGACLTPKRPSLPGFIVFDVAVKPGGPTHMEALIHETLHAALPKLSERDTVTAAHALMKVLRKSGFELRKAKP